jgi:hypothetical protein
MSQPGMSRMIGMAGTAEQGVRLVGVLPTPERYQEDRKATTGFLLVESREKIEMFPLLD